MWRREEEGIEEQWKGMEERLKRSLREVEEGREEEIKIGRSVGKKKRE